MSDNIKKCSAYQSVKIKKKAQNAQKAHNYGLFGTFPHPLKTQNVSNPSATQKKIH